MSCAYALAGREGGHPRWLNPGVRCPAARPVEQGRQSCPGRQQTWPALVVLYDAGRRESELCDVCVFITAVPITKLFAWGEGDSGGHVAREKTSRGLRGLVCPSRTGERGGEGDCIVIGVGFITAGSITKLFAWGEEESGGHVL